MSEIVNCVLQFHRFLKLLDKCILLWLINTGLKIREMCNTTRLVQAECNFDQERCANSSEPRLYVDCQISLLLSSFDFRLKVNPVVIGKTEILSENYLLFPTLQVLKVPRGKNSQIKLKLKMKFRSFLSYRVSTDSHRHFEKFLYTKSSLSVIHSFLLFVPEVGDITILRNIGIYLPLSLV